MSYRTEIVGRDFEIKGWFEVDPFDYSYSGDSTDVYEFLDGLKNGTVGYTWGADVGSDEFGEYPPEYTLKMVINRMNKFDSIWFVSPPDNDNL